MRALSPHQREAAEIGRRAGWQADLDQHGFLWLTKDGQAPIQIAHHVPQSKVATRCVMALTGALRDPARRPTLQANDASTHHLAEAEA